MPNNERMAVVESVAMELFRELRQSIDGKGVLTAQQMFDLYHACHETVIGRVPQQFTLQKQ